MLFRTVFLKLSGNRAVRGIATNSRVAKRLITRFVPGERIEQAIEAGRELNDSGQRCTLDHLGENVYTREEAAAATEMNCSILDAIAAAGIDSGISIKLTGCGLDIDPELCLENARRVVSHAASHNRFVRIDMEGSDYTERTMDIFCRLYETHKNCGIVLQSYLYRSERDTRRLIELGASVRLCKGAYREPAEVAFPDKADVDRNFIHLTSLLLSAEAREKGVFPAIATHDEAMIDATLEMVRTLDYPKERFEFQMLYGVRRDLQTRLTNEGYRVRIYVPFGTEWYPYFMRRLAERPANVAFILKNLFKG